MQVTLFVPKGVHAKVTYQDDGFNGYGEDVAIVHDSKLEADSTRIPLRVHVLVPARRAEFPVAVFLTTGDGRSTKATGKTNRVIEVRSAVPAGD